MRKTLYILFPLLLAAALLFPAAAFAAIDSLTLSSYLAGVSPDYRIMHSVSGTKLLQEKNDCISLTFSDKVELPEQIPASEVVVNNVKSREVRVNRARSRIEILLPVDLMVTLQADIEIKPGAGIKNPSIPGRYAVGVSTSQLETISRYEYTVVSGTVSTPRVEVSSSYPTEIAEYTISFNASSDGGLVGGSDTITVAFPKEIALPNEIKRSSFTVNGWSLESGDAIKPAGDKIFFTVPPQASVQPGERVTLKLKPEAGIHNPVQPGKYTLSVATSKDIIPVASEIYYISGLTVQEPSVDVSPATSNFPGQFLVKFITSPNGALKGGSDIVSIVFPYECDLPGAIPNSSIEFQGSALDIGSVAIKDKTIRFTVPSGIDVAPGKQADIKIKTDANIINPRVAGNYTLKILTSSDLTAATTNVFKIFDKKLILITVDSTTATVDGKTFTLDVPATILNGRTLVPIRFVAESTGAQVGWDNGRQEVTISLDGKTIILTIDSGVARVNQLQQTLDAAPVIKDGRTMVPVRFVAESLGSEVGWDEATQTVRIRK